MVSVACIWTKTLTEYSYLRAQSRVIQNEQFAYGWDCWVRKPKHLLAPS